MGGDVEVLIPWQGGDADRERALTWTRQRHGYPTRLATRDQGGPWSKGEALAGALEASGADVVVVADADVYAPGLEAAVAAVRLGAGWATPHRGVFRLTREGTARVLAGERWEDQPLEQRPYRATEGGGVVVAARATLEDAPLDPRFIGWGQEDEAWGVALRTLAGPPHREAQPLVHLWHPPQERQSRRYGSEAGRALYERYEAAAGDTAAMLELIQEAKRCRSQTC